MANLLFRQTLTPSIPVSVGSGSAVKGTPLTNAEGDYNLWALSQDLANKANASNPVFSGLAQFDQFSLANGLIKRYSAAYAASITNTGFRIGTYSRGPDGRKAVFNIKARVQKSPGQFVDLTGKIQYESTTGTAVSVNYWSDSETISGSGYSAALQVWADASGNLSLFIIPSGSTSFNVASYDVDIYGADVYTNFSLDTSYTVTSTTGLTLIAPGAKELINSGSGTRIRSDLSNSTPANRTAFQTSVTNGSTILSFLPAGTGVVAGIKAYGGSDPTNSSYLSIQSNGTTDTRIISDAEGSGTKLPLTFYVNGTEKVRVQTDGKVGVGTNAPSQLLHIAGNSRIDGSIESNTSTSIYSWAGGASGDLRAGLNLDGSNKVITFSTNSNEIVRINASGNVGIGTNSPTTKLHVNGVVTASGMALSTALPVSSGGTGAPDADTALTNLGLSAVGKSIVTALTGVAARTALATTFQSHNNAPSVFQATTLEAGFYTNDGTGLLNKDGSATFLSGYWHVLVFYHTASGYASQLAIELSDGNGSRMYLRCAEGSTWGEWASISGKRVMNGGASSTTNMNAQANDFWYMTSGNTLTLPANPVPGDQVTIYNYSTNRSTVLRNGKNIMSLAEDLTLDINNATVTLTYLESGIGWSL